MRGRREPQVSMLAFIDLETRVPAGHPLRTIKGLADRALAQLSPEFDRMYAQIGRPSIPPERLLKASLLISLYSVCSERGFCEQLDYNLLFRWFLGMNLMEPSFDPTVFTKNRERLLKHRVGQALFDEVVLEADRRGLLSDEHFTVDGTLIEAAASLKSFKPKDGDPPKTTDDDPGNPSVDFHGERRSNATHQSTTDPEARLLRKGKGKEAKLVFMAHALMENRHGLLVDFQTTQATGTAERDTVPVLVDQAKERGFHPKTLGGDKGYDTGDCVAALRQRGLTPHVAQNTNGRSSAIDGRTTRHPGYAISHLKWHADGEEELMFPAMDRVAPLVAQGYLHDHNEFDTMTEGLAKITAASDSLVAARETAALTAVLRIHLDKEDIHLYPTLRERTSGEEQAAIVGGMAQKVPPERTPEFIRWLFSLLGHDDREMWTRVVMGLLPEQVFAGLKLLIRDTITDDWAELTRRIPELAS